MIESFSLTLRHDKKQAALHYQIYTLLSACGIMSYFQSGLSKMNFQKLISRIIVLKSNIARILIH